MKITIDIRYQIYGSADTQSLLIGLKHRRRHHVENRHRTLHAYELHRVEATLLQKLLYEIKRFHRKKWHTKLNVDKF